MSQSRQHDDEILGKAYDAKLVRRVLPWLRPHVPLIGAAIALVFIVAAASLARPLLVRRLIDHHLVLGDASGVGLLMLLFILALAVEMVARFGHLYLTEWTGQNVVLALRSRVFSHLQRLDSSFFDTNPVGRLMSRVTTDIEALADLFSTGVVTLLGDSLKLFAIVGILCWLDWRLAMVTLTVVPILFVLSILFRSRIRHTYREVRKRIARINASLQEALSGMLLVQLFRNEPHQRETFTELNRDHRDSELQSVVYESSFSAVVEMIANFAIALIAWYGGGRHLFGPDLLTLGTLIAFLQYAAHFFGPIRELSGFYAVMQAAMASLERIFLLLDVRPKIADPAGVARSSPARGRVEFDDVCFAYHTEEPVLHGVSFHIEPGERIAVVGATGAGKTTLVKLLIRLYDPTGGSIRVDGVDIREMPLKHVRSQVGVVMQDHVLVTGTVRDNIAFGDASLTDERVREVARLAHADDFIRRFPAGYDEPIRERGGNLSVGQKQLISFARALAYDPAILVLDEATSSVDTETESLIQDALSRLLEGRTSLIIAHRLSTIIGADRIFVFHHGRLVEEGSHQALLERRGIYHRLYQLQFGLGLRTGIDADPDRPGGDRRQADHQKDRGDGQEPSSPR